MKISKQLRESLLLGTSLPTRGSSRGARGKRSSLQNEGSEGTLPEEEGPQGLCPCVQDCQLLFKSKLRVFNAISATNLKINKGPRAGSWDSWGVYYCSARFARRLRPNNIYFGLVLVTILGQGSMMFNLVSYMMKYGGAAFLVILALMYLTVGYPLFILETMMGQYSGRKPIQMLRLMLPIMSCTCPILYLRTLVNAIDALGMFIYSAHLSMDLFFCKTNNEMIYRFLSAERRQPEFSLFSSSPNYTKTETNAFKLHTYSWWWGGLTSLGLLVLVSQNLRLIGKIMQIFGGILMLGMGGYVLVGVSRIGMFDSIQLSKNETEFFVLRKPLMSVLTPNWKYLIKGRAWVDASLFVVQSMELGTLVHPYLGSLNFFHYRCPRDGMFFILIAYLWNVGGTIGAIAWLGYVGVNKSEIKGALERMHGHYGMLLVFSVKHIQGELTQMVQRDILFFAGCFYAIVGAAALCALVVYVFILVDTSYPESGQLLLKFGVMFFVILFFGLVGPLLMTYDDSLRFMIFINFYAHRHWNVFFVVFCYFLAVSFGHDLGKFVHDFLNMVHLRGYQSKMHTYHMPRTLRYFILTFLVLGMISMLAVVPYPQEGQAGWSTSSIYIGNLTSIIPAVLTISVGIYYRVKYGKDSLRSHRDWFKNKHHRNVCFADFENFEGMPQLRDPETAAEHVDAKRKSHQSEH